MTPMCPPGGTYSIGRDSHFPATDLPVGPVGPDRGLYSSTHKETRDPDVDKDLRPET